jgi:ABC-2 type transport system ATP-binding protein
MIESDHLTMYYGPFRALNDVSFEVRQGEIVGLVGPNGAGKSTTMKILTTYLHPTQGTAKVAGFDVLAKPLEVRKRIGYLPEIPPLYLDMEVRGYLNFVGKARGLAGDTLRERRETVIEQTGLRPMFRKTVRSLSKGFKQRTALAQALIHDPEIIVLDEPTSGLDPHQILEIRRLVRELAENKTVLLSTHILQEIEASADRIVIINRGEVAGDGTFDALRERAKHEERTRFGVSAPRGEVEPLIAAIAGVTRVEFEGEKEGHATFVVYSDAGSSPQAALGQLVKEKNWQVRELADWPLSLEETFLLLTKPPQEAAA